MGYPFHYTAGLNNKYVFQIGLIPPSLPPFIYQTSTPTFCHTAILAGQLSDVGDMSTSPLTLCFGGSVLAGPVPIGYGSHSLCFDCALEDTYPVGCPVQSTGLGVPPLLHLDNCSWLSRSGVHSLSLDYNNTCMVNHCMVKRCLGKYFYTQSRICFNFCMYEDCTFLHHLYGFV